MDVQVDSQGNTQLLCTFVDDSLVTVLGILTNSNGEVTDEFQKEFEFEEEQESVQKVKETIKRRIEKVTQKIKMEEYHQSRIEDQFKDDSLVIKL